MAIGLVVEVHHMRLRMFVGLVLNKRLDGRQVRECLHAKLAVEPAAQAVENLVLLLRTVPYWITVSQKAACASLSCCEVTNRSTDVCPLQWDLP